MINRFDVIYIGQINIKVLDMLSTIEKNQRLKESNLSSLEAFRAIYIDFEGFNDMAPTFAGVLIEDSFEQVLFDIDLALAGLTIN